VPPLSFSTPLPLSVTPEGGFDGDDADKAKLVAMTRRIDGGGFERVLLVVYLDAQGPEIWEWDGTRRPAFDVFATRSTDEGASWSTPVNLSGTAGSSSIATDDDGTPATPPVAYSGDSGNPRVVNTSSGSEVVVAWPDRFCPGGAQGTVVYPDAGGIEVPYACILVARSLDGGGTWSPAEQLTDASRDANDASGQATGRGFALVWQEDPAGLQPGEGEGPGEGGSGAKVSAGTDIWFTGLTTTALRALAPFPTPVPATDNAASVGSDPGGEEGGVGASRPNVILDGGTAVLVYEESKGLGLPGSGKYVRYHVFSAFDDSLPDATLGAGWILSDVAENARRARVIKQSDAFKSESDLRILFLWRQGVGDQGAPADIMARVGVLARGVPGSTGFEPDALAPAIDPLMPESNAPAWNLSSEAGIDAATEAQPLENARAHRAFLRGDLVVAAYVWAPDGALADASDQANYDLFVRRSSDLGASWDTPRNLSQLADPRVSVVEPRLVPTTPSPDPAEMLAPDRWFVAWGNEMTLPTLETVPLAIDVTWTDDAGEHYAPAVPLPGEATGQFAAQLRTTAAGDVLGVIWQQSGAEGVDVLFSAPEPGAIALGAGALAALAWARRRRRSPPALPSRLAAAPQAGQR
jgi:hypothetical protein